MDSPVSFAPLTLETPANVQRVMALAQRGAMKRAAEAAVSFDALLPADRHLLQQTEQDASRYIRAASIGQPEYLQQAHILLLLTHAGPFKNEEGKHIVHQAAWYLYAWAQSVLEEQATSPEMLEVMLGAGALNAATLRQVGGGRNV
jgi:hypothetical protein